MKRIVFVGLNGEDFPETRVRCRNFADELRAYGWDARVFTFRSEFMADREDVSLFKLPDAERDAMARAAVERLSAMGPAIFVMQKVHYHAAAVYSVCRRNGWPMALDYDDYDLDRSPLFNNKSLCESWFDAYGAEPVTRRLAEASRLCVVSSSELKHLVGNWNDRCELVETGVDAARFPFQDRSQSSSRRRLAWTGQVWGEPIMRSLDMAFEAVRHLYRKGWDVSLDLYGRGHEAEVRRHVSRKYPNVPIHCRGWVTPDAMCEALAGADAGLYPLVFSNIDYRWMISKSPTKMFEYMATGVPVAAVDTPEIRRILDDGRCGLLCRNGRHMALELDRLFQNPEQATMMAQQARRRIESLYSLKVLGARLDELYSAVWQER